ncbi:hypothetical protein D8674_012666 [Pyrus ussuriensis x Pyrus communis]|uniref:Uncharacterized protein n=1 Tax=Pyrus ussuriensis x Pyrus communis TaxID=2448454 RepID=A0A5N5G2D6_9ROSA|nr:hypothetical protein D8674_012666 [Pyrus ussuriensis x Pyrus communis]
MESEAFHAAETVTSVAFLKLLLVLFPGALLLAISFDSSSEEVLMLRFVIEVGRLILQIMIKMAMFRIKSVIENVLFVIFLVILYPLALCCRVTRNAVALLGIVAWSCRVMYRLIALVALTELDRDASRGQEGEEGGDSDHIVPRLKESLQSWLIEFEAELRKGNYSNPAIVAARSVHLLQ